MNGHHLILGELTDVVSGKKLQDTHDERYRQKIARLLIEEKGYVTGEIEPRRDLLVQTDNKRAIIKIDFIVILAGKAYMLIKYGPGSIVTRRRPALAASRLLYGYQIPVVIVTNGEDAEILSGLTGKITATGLAAIPGRRDILNNVEVDDFRPILPARKQRESRILFAYEVDDSCPCDDNICRL